MVTTVSKSIDFLPSGVITRMRRVITPAFFVVSEATQEDTGLGGKKWGKLYRYKEIFFGTKILAMIRHVYFQSCGAHFYIQRSTSSVPPKRNNLTHFTTFYNILQHFTTFATFYNIHTTFTTFYNILQHYPWRCVVSPEGR
jgi:hypothetical protein